MPPPVVSRELRWTLERPGVTGPRSVGGVARARAMAEEGVTGVFRLAVAPLAGAGAGGQQALAAADGVVQDIQAVKRYLCV